MMEINNCPKCGSETVTISRYHNRNNNRTTTKIECDDCYYEICGLDKSKLINEWNKKLNCPVCNTPLNESMFCVKCCSKWLKTTQGTPEKETIEESEIEWSDIDSITNMPKTSKQLADEHWGYIEALLKAHEEEFNIKQIEFHYKSAFIHGYKHAIEDK